MLLELKKLRFENAKLKREMEHQNKEFKQRAEELEQERINFMAEKEKVTFLANYLNLLEIYVESRKPCLLDLHLKM